MGNFLKMFFASLLAILIFFLVLFFLFMTLIAGLAKGDTPVVEKNSVLVLNLSNPYMEQEVESPLADFVSNDDLTMPGVYDVVRLINKAKNDANIKGIYLVAGQNPNGFATCEEIRNALEDFKKSKKFLIAYADAMDQRSFYVANVADKIYVNPKGYFEWKGYSVELMFLKGTLEKLEIEPQIFYAGKFKSATEPFRTDKMTDANRLQTTVWLGDLYSQLLLKTAETRKIDTATLHQMANEGTIQTPQNAVDHHLIDGVKYDDEVKDQLKHELGLGKYDKMNFISINTYFKTGGYKKFSGDPIALIYAQGNIIDGSSNEQGQIAGNNYVRLIRKARLDRSIKAIVFRVNSGGGSALASETIWRELSLAKKEKPVVVSFGDVAASGGYYISCAADSIFASPVTITGSIGVFGIIPNMEKFFKNKLGVTFDGVKTGPYADAGSVYRPLSENEKQFIQQSIEDIYGSFKQRVADGRELTVDYVDSIAQGRVWSGDKGIKIGLVDRFGGLKDAVACAARMAKLSDYRVKEYPEVKNIFDRLLGRGENAVKTEAMKKELGEDNYKLYREFTGIRQMTNKVQTRLPFSFFIR